MPRHSDYYSQLNSQCIINGVPLRDFSDGNSIRTRPGGDESVLTKGTDGATVNLSNDQTGAIEVDLKETSPSNDILSGFLIAQRSGIFLNIAGVVIDGAGAVHSGLGGTIKQKAGSDTGGPAMGKRTWIFEFPIFNPEV